MIQFYYPTGQKHFAMGVGPSPNPHSEWSHERGTVGKLMALCDRQVPFYNLYETEPERWSRRDARQQAQAWMDWEQANVIDTPTLLMLGTKVCDAFGVRMPKWLQVYRLQGNIAGMAVPHPSGLNRWWNDPRNEAMAAVALREAARGKR